MSSVIVEPIVNRIEIETMSSGVTVSLFDVYTTTYFLSESMLLEEHKEVSDAA